MEKLTQNRNTVLGAIVLVIGLAIIGWYGGWFGGQASKEVMTPATTTEQPATAAPSTTDQGTTTTAPSTTTQ
jgi:xanthine/uracil permease